MRLILDPWTDRPAVESLWRSLETTCRPGYFLTWAWIENWLATLPVGTTLKLVAFVDAHGPEAAWFIGERVVFHGGVIPIRARFLNATGFDEFDELTIEHNGWLARDPAAWPLDRVIAALDPGWDEVVMSALDAELAGGSTRAVTTRTVACHVVALDKVRAATDYLALLDGETRAQIRRAQRRYAERGELRLEVAADLAEARAMFDELVELHTAAWARRGQLGAFSPYLRRFHARLIEQRFAHGEIQLVRVRAGDTTVGCLYNLVHDDVVAFYQSGLAYESDNKLKPGLVCHALAIAHAAERGHQTYDFLGGDTRYKRSLATDATELAWCTVRQTCMRFAVEDRARDLLHRWRLAVARVA